MVIFWHTLQVLKLHEENCAGIEKCADNGINSILKLIKKFELYLMPNVVSIKSFPKKFV